MNQFQHLSPLHASAHPKPLPMPAAFQIREQAGRIFVKVEESLALAVESAGRALLQCLDAPHFFQNVMEGLQRFRACVPHEPSGSSEKEPD
jgi:hypothetical protein